MKQIIYVDSGRFDEITRNINALFLQNEPRDVYTGTDTDNDEGGAIGLTIWNEDDTLP